MPPPVALLAPLLACLVLAGAAARTAGAQVPAAMVYVVDHGWHTGLVVAAEAARQWIAVSRREEVRAAAYFEFGWGEGRFYRSPEVTAAMALQAALSPEEPVMHVVALPEPPHAYFPGSNVVSVQVSTQDMQRLGAYLERSFASNPQGEPEALGPGLYGASRFYRATGRYGLFNNCNHWTARALQAAGVPVRIGEALTAEGLMAELARLGAATAQ